MKIKAFKNGHATLEKNGAFYTVRVYKGTELFDKIRCDTYRAALDYFRAFSAIAKNA